MLFDLRGRGRRRTVQGIYLGLAILMGGGLVFFGVGGSGVGLFGNDNGGSGSVDTKQFERRATSAQKYAQAHPKQASAWAAVATARYKEAGVGGNFDDTNKLFTDKATPVLREAAAAWKRYLKLSPEKVDPTLARYMASVYGPDANDIPQNLQRFVAPTGGLSEPAEAARALEYVTAADPSSNGYFLLAAYATLAGQTRKASLAGQKAAQLAPKAQRGLYRAQLALIGVSLPKEKAKPKAKTTAPKAKKKTTKKSGSGQKGSSNSGG